MSEWAARRFWSTASVRQQDDGWSVALDERGLVTPARRPLVVPTREMAEAVAEEWDRQSDRVDPATMPVTRAANAALDKVSAQREDVVRALAAYGETDLLCYRAEAPEALAARQSRAWDPLLRWAAQDLGADLVPFAGVMPRPQKPEALSRLADRVRALDVFTLTAFHDLVMLSGSLILGLAVTHRRLDGATAWEISMVDERWQAEQWGIDAEAEAAETVRRAAFLDAERFDRLAQPSPDA